MTSRITPGIPCADVGCAPLNSLRLRRNPCKRAGLIRYTRGHVTIIDRAGLEAVSCECYAVIKAELDQVSPQGPER